MDKAFKFHDFGVHTINTLKVDLGDEISVPVAYGVAVGRLAALSQSCCDRPELLDDAAFVQNVREVLGYQADSHNGGASHD